MEPRRGCPFLKLESLYSPIPIHIHTGDRSIQTLSVESFSNIVELNVSLSEKDHNHGFIDPRKAEKIFANDCVVLSFLSSGLIMRASP